MSVTPPCPLYEIFSVTTCSHIHTYKVYKYRLTHGFRRYIYREYTRGAYEYHMRVMGQPICSLRTIVRLTTSSARCTSNILCSVSSIGTVVVVLLMCHKQNLSSYGFLGYKESQTSPASTTPAKSLCVALRLLWYPDNCLLHPISPCLSHLACATVEPPSTPLLQQGPSQNPPSRRPLPPPGRWPLPVQPPQMKQDKARSSGVF